MNTSIVSIENLSHRYTHSWAIRDINMEINGYGIYGLLGSNGAGKSTTMNILCGVLNQKEGTVKINGINIRENPIEAKMLIGYLPQNAPLYLDLTVREYLLYCARLRCMVGSDIDKAIEDVMEKCGITHVKDRLLKNLSGGYRQRAGIAQAIVHSPKLVILDEPTNGLDPMQIIEVRKLIKNIALERTVILSSHILTEIQLMCERIIMIEQGRLVFSDSIDSFNNYITPQSLLLEMEHAPSMERLRNINGVEQVEQLTKKDFRIYYNGEKEVSAQIISASAEEGWKLYQLVIEKNSVDEIFKQLIKNSSNS